MPGFKFGKGKKPAAAPKVATSKGSGGGGTSARKPGGTPMAPPGLAKNMRAPSPTPRMLKKGGKVRGC